MLSQFLPDNTAEGLEMKTPILKIRGRTLVFGNVVYQIHNISSIGLVDLTSIKPIPQYYWLLLIGGIVLIFTQYAQAMILGIILLIFVAWLFYKYKLNKIKERYGMTIYTNAGTKVIFASRSSDFIKRAILILYNVMNSDEYKNISLYFTEGKIEIDKSTNIGTNIGSPVTSGNVQGDVVSNV